MVEIEVELVDESMVVDFGAYTDKQRLRIIEHVIMGASMPVIVSGMTIVDFKVKQ